MHLLEENPNAGEPLLGGLIGWRKLTVGDRDWRVVWRSTTDSDSTPIIEVAEVWAVVARSDSDIHEEMAARVAAMPKNPRTVALAEGSNGLASSASAIRRLRSARAARWPHRRSTATGWWPGHGRRRRRR